MILINLVYISNGRVKCVLGQLTCLRPVTSHLVEKHRVVQGQTQSDRISGSQFLLSLLTCLLVCYLCIVSRLLVFLSISELRNISVVVAFHLQVKYLCLRFGSLLNQLAINQLNDLNTVSVKLGLDLLLILFKNGDVFGAFGLLFFLYGV